MKVREKGVDYGMIRRKILINIALLVILSLFPPSQGVYPADTYLGNVVNLDPAQQTMTITTDSLYRCTPAGLTMECSWVATNRTVLEGVVPDTAVFSVMKVSDTVEASQVIEDTRQWVSIARVFPTHDTYLATDLIGDSAFLHTSLAGEIQVFYSLTPDCLQCKDSVCQAQSATITVNRSGTMVFGATLNPGEEGEFMEKDPDAQVRVTFIKGETLPAGCPSKELPVLSNVQLKRVFIISIDLDNEDRAVITATPKPMLLPLAVNTSYTSDIQKTQGISPSVSFTEPSLQDGDNQLTPAVSSSFPLTVLIVAGLFFAFRKK